MANYISLYKLCLKFDKSLLCCFVCFRNWSFDCNRLHLGIQVVFFQKKQKTELQIQYIMKNNNVAVTRFKIIYIYFLYKKTMCSFNEMCVVYYVLLCCCCFCKEMRKKWVGKWRNKTCLCLAVKWGMGGGAGQN